MTRALASVVAALLALLASACSVSVAGGLDESDANRIVLALDRASIDATKETDPLVENKFRVNVPRDDAARALSAMRAEELPRPRSSGVLDAMDRGSLVPSEAAEHAEFVAGLAGDLERTLESVDGVLSARVHLNVPSPEPLRDAPLPKTTASVLLEHRGTTPPLSEGAVQRLVAGGVPNLLAPDVAVVQIPRLAAPLPGENTLGHVGPIAVARASVRTLQLALMGLVATVAILAGIALALFSRLRKIESESALAAKP